MDNHLSDCVYPVLMSKRQDEDSSAKEGSDRGDGKGGGGARQETPFLQISIIKEVNQATNTAHFDYVAFR